MVHILYKCPNCRAKAASRIPTLSQLNRDEHDDQETSLWYFFDMCSSCKDIIKDGYESTRPWVYEPATPNDSEVSMSYYLFTIE